MKRKTHPRDLRLEVQVAGRQETADVEPVPLPVLEARALVVQRVLNPLVMVFGIGRVGDWMCLIDKGWVVNGWVFHPHARMDDRDPD